MISIVEAISELLFVRDTVVVPGLGAFVQHEISAKVNVETNRFVSPSCEVGFDANHREDNDLIINYIAERNDWNKTRANQQLVLFVTDTFDKLKKGEKVVLERIGTLFYNSDNGLVDNMIDTVKGGASQAIPSLARQIGQVADPYERDLNNGNYDINSIVNK